MLRNREFRAVRQIRVGLLYRLLVWNPVTERWVLGAMDDVDPWDGVPFDGWVYQIKLNGVWEPYDSPKVHGMEEVPYPNGLPR